MRRDFGILNSDLPRLYVAMEQYEEAAETCRFCLETLCEIEGDRTGDACWVDELIMTGTTSSRKLPCLFNLATALFAQLKEGYEHGGENELGDESLVGLANEIMTVLEEDLAIHADPPEHHWSIKGQIQYPCSRLSGATTSTREDFAALLSCARAWLGAHGLLA